MIPRGNPDIGWRDLAFGLWSCLGRADPLVAQALVEAAWDPAGRCLACLSVRSGFDLVLRALALPPGSEVLVSAVTIPDMIRILEHHGLHAVPVDLQLDTLALDEAMLARAVRPQTRAILVAHLFGSRMPLDAVACFAREHGLYLFEDCAQAYDGAGYRGHPASDVRMFSFGPIKTATALGGAILSLNDPALLAAMRTLQRGYGRQPRRAVLRRIALIGLLKLLAQPAAFTLFVALCRLRGVEHDQVLSGALRSFPGADLLARIRQQPSAPLLRLLRRRLRQPTGARVARRMAFVRRVAARLPHTARLGSNAHAHSHWVFPIRTDAPERLLRLLWLSGFDATQRASSLYAVPAPPDRPEQQPARMARALAQIVYLPIAPTLPEREIARLARIVTDFEAAQGARHAGARDDEQAAPERSLTARG